MKTEHLGTATDLEAFDRLPVLKGLSIVDVGCNNGALTRALAERGAQVTGLEPNSVQAAANREADPVPGVTFVEAGAQEMPFDDHSIDGVIFSRSLHHVPEPLMDQALHETMRVLKSDTGFLYALEPDMGGQYSQVLKPFHDETHVRAAALEALARCADPHFSDISEYWFTRILHYNDFEELRTRTLANVFNQIDPGKIDQPVVRALFEAAKTKDGYTLTNPMRIRLYRGLKA